MKNVNMINDKIKKLLSSSWKLYVENITYIIGLYLFVSIIGATFNYIINQSGSISSIQNIIFYFSSELFLIGLSLGLLKILLLLSKKQDANWGLLFSSFDLIFRSLNASILFSLTVFLAILPGIIIILISCDLQTLFNSILSLIDFSAPLPSITFEPSNFLNIDIHNTPLFILGISVSIINIIWCVIRFQFYQYFIVEEECGAFKSLQKSFFLTDNKTNILLQCMLILFLLNFLGLMFFLVGLIITVPFSLLLMSKMYLDLKRGSL